jgi:hypothetical protein
MTTSSTPEDTIAESKRRADECYALLESTMVPEYRQALSAMAKAWMKIAQNEQKTQAKSARIERQIAGEGRRLVGSYYGA